jgi:hypothetical protein
MAPPDLKKKGAAFGKTCQAEAIDPPDLANIVRQGIEIRFDMDAYRCVLKRENHDRAALIQRLSR